MWPWEHLAVGYLCYSVLIHVWSRRSPDGVPVIVLLVATQLPDLIDKPLAWWLGVLPSGTSLGHSLLFSVTVLVLTWLFAGRRLAVPIGVGLLTHLLGDITYPLLIGRSASYSFLFWPFIEAAPVETLGLLFRTSRLFREFLEFLTTSQGIAYIGFELLVLGSALVLWLRDGRPGLSRDLYQTTDTRSTDPDR